MIVTACVITGNVKSILCVVDGLLGFFDFVNVTSDNVRFGRLAFQTKSCNSHNMDLSVNV